MDESFRLTLAYGMIGLLTAIGVPALVIYLRKRKRQKLRRRGVKRYGH